MPEPYSRAFQVIYVTRTLFDCDSSNIEYIFQAATNSFKSFYIMRTDSTQIFKLDSANGPFCAGSCLGFSDIIQPIKNTSAGSKLFLQRPYSAYNGKIFIYSLCGTLPVVSLTSLNKIKIILQYSQTHHPRVLYLKLICQIT